MNDNNKPYSWGVINFFAGLEDDANTEVKQGVAGMEQGFSSSDQVYTDNTQGFSTRFDSNAIDRFTPSVAPQVTPVEIEPAEEVRWLAQMEGMVTDQAQWRELSAEEKDLDLTSIKDGSIISTTQDGAVINTEPWDSEQFSYLDEDWDFNIEKLYQESKLDMQAEERENIAKSLSQFEYLDLTEDQQEQIANGEDIELSDEQKIEVAKKEEEAYKDIRERDLAETTKEEQEYFDKILPEERRGWVDYFFSFGEWVWIQDQKIDDLGVIEDKQTYDRVLTDLGNLSANSELIKDYPEQDVVDANRFADKILDNVVTKDEPRLKASLSNMLWKRIESFDDLNESEKLKAAYYYHSLKTEEYAVKDYQPESRKLFSQVKWYVSPKETFEQTPVYDSIAARTLELIKTAEEWVKNWNNELYNALIKTGTLERFFNEMTDIAETDLKGGKKPYKNILSTLATAKYYDKNSATYKVVEILNSPEYKNVHGRNLVWSAKKNFQEGGAKWNLLWVFNMAMAGFSALAPWFWYVWDQLGTGWRSLLGDTSAYKVWTSDIFAGQDLDMQINESEGFSWGAITRISNAHYYLNNLIPEISAFATTFVTGQWVAQSIWSVARVFSSMKYMDTVSHFITKSPTVSKLIHQGGGLTKLAVNNSLRGNKYKAFVYRTAGIATNGTANFIKQLPANTYWNVAIPGLLKTEAYDESDLKTDFIIDLVLDWGLGGYSSFAKWMSDVASKKFVQEVSQFKKQGNLFDIANIQSTMIADNLVQGIANKKEMDAIKRIIKKRTPKFEWGLSAILEHTRKNPTIIKEAAMDLLLKRMQKTMDDVFGLLIWGNWKKSVFDLLSNKWAINSLSNTVWDSFLKPLMKIKGFNNEALETVKNSIQWASAKDMVKKLKDVFDNTLGGKTFFDKFANTSDIKTIRAIESFMDKSRDAGTIIDTIHIMKRTWSFKGEWEKVLDHLVEQVGSITDKEKTEQIVLALDNVIDNMKSAFSNKNAEESAEKIAEDFFGSHIVNSWFVDWYTSFLEGISCGITLPSTIITILPFSDFFFFSGLPKVGFLESSISLGTRFG